MNNPKIITYVIGHRTGDDPFRLKNLLITTRWLIRIKNLLPLWIVLHIVVIEQDKSPTVNVLLDSDIDYIFAYNDGFYNRGWAFNVGVREYPQSDYYFFADNDIVMSDRDSIRVFTDCFSYEAINPYRKIYDSLPCIHNDNPFDLFYRDGIDSIKLIILGEREGTCFSGGIVGLSNEAISLISGWDERFRGRGWEDYAFTSKIKLFLKKIHTYESLALHIYHPWEQNTTREINQVLDIEYSEYRTEHYVIHILTSKYGDINKYRLPSQKSFHHSYNTTTKLFKRAIRGDEIYKRTFDYVSRLHDIDSHRRITYLNLCDQHDCKRCNTCDIDKRCESGNHCD